MYIINFIIFIWKYNFINFKITFFLYNFLSMGFLIQFLQKSDVPKRWPYGILGTSLFPPEKVYRRTWHRNICGRRAWKHGLCPQWGIRCISALKKKKSSVHVIILNTNSIKLSFNESWLKEVGMQHTSQISRYILEFTTVIT